MFSFYLTHEYWFAAAQLSLAMLGMGATLTPKDFNGIVKAPRAFTIGMVMQLLLVPLVAFLFISLSGAAVRGSGSFGPQHIWSVKYSNYLSLCAGNVRFQYNCAKAFWSIL